MSIKVNDLKLMDIKSLTETDTHSETQGFIFRKTYKLTDTDTESKRQTLRHTLTHTHTNTHTDTHTHTHM